MSRWIDIPIVGWKQLQKLSRGIGLQIDVNICLIVFLLGFSSYNRYIEDSYRSCIRLNSFNKASAILGRRKRYRSPLETEDMGSEVKGYRVLVLGLIILAAFSLRMQAFLTFPSPSGSDPGLRVKNAYLLSKEWVNITYPAFDATLSLLWINTGENTKGLILSTELFVSAVMAFCAASMYCISNRVFRDRKASLTVAFLAAFSAPTYELVSFGSYPQGLSLFLIPLIFAIALKKDVRSDISRAVCLGLLAASLLMMHFWSFIICTIVIIFFSVMDYTRLTLKGNHEVVMTRIITLIIPLLALLFSAPWWIPIAPFLQKTLLYAPVGATSIRGVGWRFERFFSPHWLYYVFLPAGLVRFLSQQKDRNIKGLLLVGSWFLTPFILMQGYRFGIGADYRRLWYYPMEPAMIVVGLGLSFTISLMFHALNETINHKLGKPEISKTVTDWSNQISESSMVQPRSILAISIIFVLAAAVFSPGWWAVREANASTRYYSHVKEPELGMMLWIGEHVEENMEIISSGSIGWWIRGLSRRHVITVIPRAFINVPWQISRAETTGILVSEASYALRNDWIQVRDSGPYWSGFNPELSIKSEEEYRSTMHMNDTGIVLQLSNGQKISLASIINRDISWISRRDDSATLQTTYNGQTISVTKTVTLRDSSSFADIELKINGIGPQAQELSILVYPNEDFTGLIILAEEYEKKIEHETADYSTSSSRWFAIYDSKNDLCSVIKFNEEIKAQLVVDQGRLLSLKFNLNVDEGKTNLRIGGFPVGDRSRLQESVEQYIHEEEQGRIPNDTTGQVSTLDYLEVLKEYGIRIIVIGTSEKHARDPLLNLIFSTGEKFIFEIS
jgi:hypothetical protein